MDNILKEIERISKVKQYEQEKKIANIEIFQKQYAQYKKVLSERMISYKERVDKIKGEIDVLRNDETQINAQIKEYLI